MKRSRLSLSRIAQVSALLTACLAVSLLAACGKSASGDASSDASSSTATDTVESLMANPKRLDELRLQCKANRAKTGDELCNQVTEATHRLFLGNGMPYTRTRVPKSLWPAAGGSSPASSANSASSAKAQ